MATITVRSFAGRDLFRITLGPSDRLSIAAVKADGSVVTWGDASYGGDSSTVEAQLASGVLQIIGSMGAFAAVKEDGSVVTWGDARNGGDNTTVQAQFAPSAPQVTGRPLRRII